MYSALQKPPPLLLPACSMNTAVTLGAQPATITAAMQPAQCCHPLTQGPLPPPLLLLLLLHSGHCCEPYSSESAAAAAAALQSKHCNGPADDLHPLPALPGVQNKPLPLLLSCSPNSEACSCNGPCSSGPAVARAAAIKPKYPTLCADQKPPLLLPCSPNTAMSLLMMSACRCRHSSGLNMSRL